MSGRQLSLGAIVFGLAALAAGLSLLRPAPPGVPVGPAAPEWGQSVTQTVTLTATPTKTATPAQPATLEPCLTLTPEPLWVEPVTSPTDRLEQTVIVRLGRGEAVTVTLETGSFSTFGDFNYLSNPARVEIALLPNTVHHLRVEGKVQVLQQGHCQYGGYTLSTTTDRDGRPLIIATRPEGWSWVFYPLLFRR